MNWLTLKHATRLLALLLTWVPALCAALPLESRVPGGIALVPIGTAAHGAKTPQAWLGERPVWVTRMNGTWIAVVGIALDTPPGPQELHVSETTAETKIRFDVSPKHYPEQHITLKDSSKVTLSPENEERAEQEIARIQQLKRHWRETVETDGNFLTPANGRLASRFGLRRFFNGEPRAPHSGLDVAVPRGTPVKASAAGRVLAADDYFFNGKTVFVDHGNGLISMVCHLDRIDVTAGEPVNQGQLLGLSGMTGRASGPHVHWSVVLNGVMVDPALFLASGANAEQHSTSARPSPRKSSTRQP